jgi:Na+/H+ antiporter NhaD/arsenite permease-like protein
LIEHLGDTAEILFFLLGAMTIVELIDQYQGFRIITDRIQTKNKRKLIWILSILTFFMSALLDNLTTSIVMCALLRKLVGDKAERWFFAGMIILAANAGGAWSPIGDVTTIMLWIGGQVSTVSIIMKTLLPSLVSLLVPLAIITISMKGEVTRPENNDSKSGVVIPGNLRVLIFSMGIGALLFVPVFKTITHLPPYIGMLLGLGVLWAVSEIINHKYKDTYTPKITDTLQRIDTPSILFFLGILLAVAGLQNAGIRKMLSEALASAFGDNFYLINLIIGVLSSIIDNVPLVAGTMGMYEIAEVGAFAMDGSFWTMLAYCAGTGGSILIIGSAAGVAVMGMEKIDFIWYLKKISWLALLGYLAGAGLYVIMDMVGYNTWVDALVM